MHRMWTLCPLRPRFLSNHSLSSITPLPSPPSPQAEALQWAADNATALVEMSAHADECWGSEDNEVVGLLPECQASVEDQSGQMDLCCAGITPPQCDEAADPAEGGNRRRLLLHRAPRARVLA